MTTMPKISIQTLTVETAEKLNNSLRDWNAEVGHDNEGPFIKLTKKKDSDGQHRQLFLDVLDEDDDLTDLVRYCWNYWNAPRAMWHVSDLSHDADFNAVFDFLVRRLDAE